MFIVPYLVGRDEPSGKIIELVVSKVLPKAPLSVSLSYKVGSRMDGDRLGVSLFLTYSDAKTSEPLDDYIFPDLPVDLKESLVAGDLIKIRDDVNSCSVTLHNKAALMDDVACA